jgi:hypothetical protein
MAAAPAAAITAAVAGLAVAALAGLALVSLPGSGGWSRSGAASLAAVLHRVTARSPGPPVPTPH